MYTTHNAQRAPASRSGSSQNAHNASQAHRLIASFLLAVTLSAPFLSLAVPEHVSAQSATTSTQALTPRVESERNPDEVRTDTVPMPAETEALADDAPQDAAVGMMAAPAALTTESFGPNLIQNPSVEDASSTSTPRGWMRGGYGTHTRVLTYPVPGSDGARGLEVVVSNYTSGDAKWYFADVQVQGGATYEFADTYKATRESILSARYTMSDGTYQYPTLGVLSAVSTFTPASVRFTVPQGAVSMTVFHLLKGNGTLVTDAFSLRKVESSSGEEQLVPNGSFESSSVAGLPDGWKKGGWGTNDRTFTYPAIGVNGSKAASVAMTSRTSGDAKWYTDPIGVSEGPYVYEDSYTATVQTYITVEYRYTNGSVTYDDVATVPPASSYTRVRAPFSVPAGVSHVRVYHLLNRAGTLNIDDVSLSRTSPGSGLFDTGGISITFDDGWLNQYRNAVPKLQSTGLKATFYITSRQLYDNGYTGFMSRAQVKELYDAGHEIGAHTRTHRALTTLSLAEREQEIAGSRADIRGWGIEPVNVFAYPFGDYDAATIDIVRNAGYVSARSTRDGHALYTDDPYQLPRFSAENDTTVAEAAAWIDAAVANKRWGILTFHQVDTNGLKYTVTPQVFNGIMDHIKAKNVRVVSVKDGVSALAQ